MSDGQALVLGALIAITIFQSVLWFQGVVAALALGAVAAVGLVGYYGYRRWRA